MVSISNISHHDWQFQLAIVVVVVAFVETATLCSHSLFVCAPVIYRRDQTNASQSCEKVATVVNTSLCTSHVSKNAYTSQRNTKHTRTLHQAIIKIICKFHQKRLNQTTCRAVVRAGAANVVASFIFCILSKTQFSFAKSKTSHEMQSRTSNYGIYLAKWMWVQWSEILRDDYI